MNGLGFLFSSLGVKGEDVEKAIAGGTEMAKEFLTEFKRHGDLLSQQTELLQRIELNTRERLIESDPISYLNSVDAFGDFVANGETSDDGNQSESAA